MRQPITYNPVYAYLEDGIPIRSTGFFNHNAMYEINVPGSERIEVFKGPATALYGSDAIGGVVNVLTRPSSAGPTGQVFAEGGEFGYARTLVTASDTWGRHGVRGDLNLTHFDGWRDKTGQDRQSGTLRHDWALGEHQRLNTVFAASFIDSPGDGGSDVSLGELESGSTVNYTPIAFRSVEAVRLSTTWKREAGPMRTDITGYLRHNRLQLLPSWQLTYDPQVWDSQNHSIGLMARVRRNLKPGNTSLVGGLDLDWSPGSRVVDQVLPQQAANGAFVDYAIGERQYDYDVTFHGISPYVQASTTWGEQLHLSGGLRYDHLGYNYDDHLGELQSGAHRRPASTDVSFDHVSPNVGASFETSRGSVFASYRHGFRVPSEDQLFVQGSAINTVDLHPVRANSIEGGGRMGLGAARFEVSAYRMDIEDDILSFFNTVDFTSETSNAGRSRHWGLEAGAELGLGDLRLAAAYGYGRHRYLEWVTSTGSDYGGNEMESSPRHVVNAHATWAPSWLARASATVEWVRVGAYFTDPANQHTYGGHDVFSVTASIPVGRSFDVLGRVNNLGDAHYANTASFNPFVAPSQQERFTPGTPRSYFLGAQYSWFTEP
jgi:outer membrane receptor protein involved in Fe transport